MKKKKNKRKKHDTRTEEAFGVVYRSSRMRPSFEFDYPHLSIRDDSLSVLFGLLGSCDSTIDPVDEFVRPVYRAEYYSHLYRYRYRIGIDRLAIQYPTLPTLRPANIFCTRSLRMFPPRFVHQRMETIDPFWYIYMYTLPKVLVHQALNQTIQRNKLLFALFILSTVRRERKCNSRYIFNCLFIFSYISLIFTFILFYIYIFSM